MEHPPDGAPPIARGGTATGHRPPSPGAAGETEFRLLGPVELHDGTTGAGIVPSGSKQRALLSALVLHADQLLSVDRLTEELWGDRPPTNAQNALQAHVARLRRLLPEPGERSAGHEWISTLPTGYQLSLGPATTDVERFQRLSALGRAAVSTDPGYAVRLLRHALSLWRGPALQDSRLGPLCASEADRLEEHRLTALESLYEASLRCAQHGQITGELEKLTIDHPLRERFYDLLMVALYRGGRQAEALGVYERARRRLVEALGIEPGPALRARMEAVLNHAPDLSAPPHLLPRGGSATLSEALELGGEIARLQRRIDELSRSQDALVRRYDSMVAHLAHTATEPAVP
ncbi:BTAD domain-containing putative transcriptional regulator [Streptomyces albogriseolus]|uniref:AfsR/SARP family transcriptional regulator n=1 Tax=Streptomyces albogriseolus TaxID=1887 RepID=UPI003792020B